MQTTKSVTWLDSIKCSNFKVAAARNIFQQPNWTKPLAVPSQLAHTFCCHMGEKGSPRTLDIEMIVIIKQY